MFLFLMALSINMQQAELEVDTMSHFKNKQLYKISDKLVNEVEINFFSKPNNYDKLHDFSNLMQLSTDFQYYIANWQPIGISNFKGSAIFGAYYESGNREKTRNRDGKDYTSIKSVQVNHNVFDLNNIQLQQGRIFDADEYILTGDNIPVILGAEYTGIYQLGDQIDIDYYFQTFKGTVVGIVQPLQKIVTNNRPELLLDRYVLLPLMSLSDSPSRLNNNAAKYPVFFKALLLTRANGMIISELDPLSIRKVVGSIAQKTGFDQFSIIGADGLRINTLVQMTEANRFTLLLVSSLMFVITMSILLLTLFIKTKKNVSTYKVLLISGATLNHVCLMISLQSLITYVIGSIIPCLITMLLTSFSIPIFLTYLLLVLLLSLFMTIMTYLFVKKIFSKLDIVRELKG
ncbi:ABC transporter ATP-binding protein [Paenibacillus sp. UMB4589-SE434]|nr:ABC transporter ATP-binding protein [Paenibacillus sp. UMB4589-SE434]